MTGFMCLPFHRLSALLRTASQLRDNCVAGNSATALEIAELNLRLVHSLISDHRSFCRHCRFNASLKSIPPSYSDSWPASGLRRGSE
jgi:hypothetical protein